MDKFLEHIRADPAKMAKGYYVPESEKPGWKKKPGHTYRNQTSTWQPGSGALGYKFTIDITNRSRPEIYLLALIV